MTLEGSTLLARAVVENHTLRQVALPLGHCHDTTERQQMIQQFGMGLASHPTLQSFACTRTPNLEYSQLNDVRENKAGKRRGQLVSSGHVAFLEVLRVV